jgi:hypothetical protein
MRFAPALAAALLLAACATTPAGEDPKGLDMRAKATPVLTALARYRKDKGAYPLSLYELVPKYLEAVPFHPGLRLDSEHGILAFVYFKEWPHTGSVTCSAKLEETTWKCVEAR